MGCWFSRARLIVLGGLGLLVPMLPGSVRAAAPVFVCPPLDLAGRPVEAQSISGTELFCRYQTVPNDFFCKYFLDTGLLLQDHDDLKCPPVASIGSAATETPTSAATVTPTNTLPTMFVCPPLDLAGRPVEAQSISGTQLFCRYQTIPNDFFCKYFLDTGLLLQDHDDLKCPPLP